MDTPSETAELHDDAFEWAIVEIMGHRRHAGRVREEERFGARMLRIDVPTILLVSPAEEGAAATATVDRWTSHYYGGSSIFSFTPTDEATVMKHNRPYEPPQRYLPRADTHFADDDEDQF